MDILTKAYHIISDAQLQKGEEVGFKKFAEKVKGDCVIFRFFTSFV